MTTPLPYVVTLTSVSGPRTKKTHGRIVEAGTRKGAGLKKSIKPKNVLLPSLFYERWEAGLRFSPDLPGIHLALWSSWRRLTRKKKAEARKVTGAPVALLAPVAMNCRALFYVERDWNGDAVGYYQAVADALEAWGVVPNDKWITSWDGSRIRIDAARPRVEVTLTLAEDP